MLNISKLRITHRPGVCLHILYDIEVILGFTGLYDECDSEKEYF